MPQGQPDATGRDGSGRHDTARPLPCAATTRLAGKASVSRPSGSLPGSGVLLGGACPNGIDTWRLGEVSPRGRGDPRPTLQLRRVREGRPLSHGFQRSRRCWSRIGTRDRARDCAAQTLQFVNESLVDQIDGSGAARSSPPAVPSAHASAALGGVRRNCGSSRSNQYVDRWTSPPRLHAVLLDG